MMNDRQPLTGSDTGHAFDETLRRVKAEYLEMPGLKLTFAQAVRLWDLDARTCRAVLAALVDAHFLVQTRNESFLRA